MPGKVQDFFQALRRKALWVHYHLLPRKADVGWMPYLWLWWVGIYFIPLAFEPTLAMKIATPLTVTLFIPLYFRFYWADGAERYLIIAAIAALSFILIPFNGAGGGLLIYAGAFVGFVLHSTKAFALLIVLAIAVSVEYFLLGSPLITWFWAPLVTIMVGLANMWSVEREQQHLALRQSQDEVRRMAATAERERIARDLHDLLGHTLTLITVKAELAGKLAARNLPQAAKEIEELEHVARDALAQVREAVGGYRGGLVREIANAQMTLTATGVAFNSSDMKSSGIPGLDSVLAMIVREAVTNIVRHAEARNCQLLLYREDDAVVVLEISDDGRGKQHKEGHGIRGMRERLQALGGELIIDSDTHGTHLKAVLPVTMGATSDLALHEGTK